MKNVLNVQIDFDQICTVIAAALNLNFEDAKELVIARRGNEIQASDRARETSHVVASLTFYDIAAKAFGVSREEAKRRLLAASYGKDAEPEFTAPDGTVRKAHYGDEKQPWDFWLENGWAPIAAASNIHKYMKRYTRKNGADDIEKARWYYARLCQLRLAGNATEAVAQLGALLTNGEFHILIQKDPS